MHDPFLFRKRKFSPGHMVITPGAQELLHEANRDWREYMARHLSGDWGELDPDDVKENNRAIRDNLRILSNYSVTDGTGTLARTTGKRIWIITEHDRSVTTIMLPEEY